jgi:Spy/CpxP family protein refolding chaperone
MKHPEIRRLVIVAMAMALLASAFAVAAAQDEDAAAPDLPRGDASFCGTRCDRMVDRLDLTDEQQQKIAGIREQGRDDCTELRKDIMRLRNELRGEMLADEPSESRILKLTDDIGAKRTELRKHQVRQQLAVREVLTPEQRDRMLLMRGRGGRSRLGGMGHDCPDGCRGPRGRGGAGFHGHGRGGAGIGCDGHGPHGRPDAECDGSGPCSRRSRGGRI